MRVPRKIKLVEDKINNKIMQIKHFKKTLIMNSKWEKTCNAVKGLLDILICSKCKKNLHDPQQFLQCGHFSCTSCINNETTKCVECEIPCGNNGIIRDETIAKIVQACCTIAQEIGSRDDIENVVKEFNKASSTEQIKSISNIVGNNGQTNNSENLTNHSRNKSSKKSKKRKGKSSLNINQASKKIKSDITAHALRIPKNLNKKNHLGETLLHEKCKKGHTIYVQRLLEAGADPNTSCAANWIPLQEAVTGGFYEITKMLLEAKANVNQQGYEGRTALHEAVEEQNSQILQLLLSYGAKKDLVDKNNKMPIDYCESEEIKDLLNEESLERNGCTENGIRISNNDVDINNEEPLHTENSNSNMLMEFNLCDNPSTKESHDNISSSKFNDNISHSNDDEDDVAIVFEKLSSYTNETNHLQETVDNCRVQQSIDVVNCDTKDGAIKNILNNVSQRDIDFTNKKENSNNITYVEHSQEITNVVNYDKHSQQKVDIMNENDNVKESSQTSLADSEEIIVD